MNYSYSKKALVLTDDKRGELVIKGVLSRAGIEIEKKVLNLSSLDTIRGLARRTANLSFIRAELYTFIQEFGYPHMVILDLRVDLGFDRVEDPDHMKLFRTFLIAYIILSMGRGFARLHCDMMVLYDEHDETLVKKLADHSFVLSLLRTKNEQVNEIIDRMKSDKALFRRILSVDYFKKSELTDSFDKAFSQLAIAIQARRNLADKMVEKSLSTLSNDDRLPADVYFNSGSAIFCNGEVASDAKTNVASGVLRIEGKWTSGTTRDVAQRVRMTLLKLANAKQISYTDDLTIELGDKCIIDASVAPALAGILIKDLSRFSNIKVTISKFNYPVLAKSEGYSMIKSFVRTLE